MFKINLQCNKCNKGIKWDKYENIYSKGYLFDKKIVYTKGKN